MAPRARRFVVLGAGGHGRVVADLVRTLGHHVVGYADADARRLAATVDGTGATVLFTQAALLACARGEGAWPFAVDAVALGIGDNAARANLLEQFGTTVLPPLIHPRSWISHSACIGPGTIVLAGAVINTDAILALGVIVNSGATIEHDCALETAVHVSPGATLCGGVHVGRGSWICAGAVVIPERSVGARCVVGAGAVVIRDVPDDTTVVGNPAHPITRECGKSPTLLRQGAHS